MHASTIVHQSFLCSILAFKTSNLRNKNATEESHIYENGQINSKPMQSNPTIMIDEINHRLMEMFEQTFHHQTVNMRNVLKMSNNTIETSLFSSFHTQNCCAFESIAVNKIVKKKHFCAVIRFRNA